ncbi:MAG: hypothetical protein JWP72_2252, partial [Massilia sp.]|nr:hypothetical protein [Massilia sp.]
QIRARGDLPRENQKIGDSQNIPGKLPT